MTESSKTPATSGGLPLGTISTAPPKESFIIAGTNPPIFRISGGSPVTGFNDSMNLFIKGTPSSSISSTTPLNIRGTSVGVGGSTLTMPLTITGSPLVKFMNLYVLGSDSGATSEVMNLFIRGTNPNTYASAPLFIQNNAGGSTKRTTLYIEGTGQNAGYFPISEDLNLFVCRGPNAGITMFVCNTQNFKTASLFISGSIPISTRALSPNTGAIYEVSRYQTRKYGAATNTRNVSPTLFIQGFGGEVTNSATLFINGNAPTPINGNVSLVIPHVSGPTPKSITLYINGFRY